MRYVYSFLFYLCLPFILLRLALKSRKLPGYRERWRERLGYYPVRLNNSIWIHAVSVGETLAALPLIKALKTRYDSIPIVVTTMTPTGAERVKAAFGNSVVHAYLPYDVPSAVDRFLNTFNPILGLIMETELWPNLLAITKKKAIPVCLLNARLSEQSARGYQRIASLTRGMLNNLEWIAAQGQQDAKRFAALGAAKKKLMITGSIKFDLSISQALKESSQTLRSQLGNERFIWLAASTHEGEEEIILAAHKKICLENKEALLIIVPRHPERFDNVFALCEKNFNTVRRSINKTEVGSASVYLADTMGELMLIYGACDVAFVGGSLIPRGGHNMLEPALLGKAILTGPHLFNFAEISDLFFKADAMIKVNDAESMANQLIMLWETPMRRLQLGRHAEDILNANRGALDRQLALVDGLMAKNVD